MEDTRFYNLLRYFSTEIRVEVLDGKVLVGGKVPLEKFYRFSVEQASRYIGECKRNIDKYNVTSEFMRQELSNHRDKFNHLYNSEFGKEYTTDASIDLETFIPDETPNFKELREAYNAELNTYTMTFNYLNKVIKSNPQNNDSHKNKRKRIKADIRDFRVNYAPPEIFHFYTEGQRLGLISKDTDQKDFVKIFQGRPAEEKINWLGTIFSLYKFINGINGKALNKINAGKWDVVSRLFLINGDSIEAKSFSSPSKAKNDPLVDVEILVDIVNKED